MADLETERVDGENGVYHIESSQLDDFGYYVT